MQTSLLVRIYDEAKNYLGKGTLSSLTTTNISLKGDQMPSLPSKSTVILHIYDELRGILVYEAVISISTYAMLNAKISKKLPTLERRKALKVKTSYDTTLRLLLREERTVPTDKPIQIRIMNLSIGGMLITSNTELMVDDIIVFSFNYYEDMPLDLDATVVRVDLPNEERHTYYYGCVFTELSRYNENVICKFLYERQLQLHSKK